MRAALIAALATGCGAPLAPHHAPSAVDATTALPSELGSPRAIAADDARIYLVADGVAADHAPPTVSAWHDGLAIWRQDLDGAPTALAVTGAAVIAGLTRMPPASRGQPGAFVAALDREHGAPHWQLAFDATDWSTINQLAALGDDVIVGGAFAGTLRAAGRVVSSAGASDGFVARVRSTGEVAWLVRVGGAGADAIQGVAARGHAIAIAGSFAAGAELLGEPLVAADARTPNADVFVAVLDDAGQRGWSASFGGRGNDACAGVAITDRGELAVAASIEAPIAVAGHQVAPRGAGDGVVVWYSATGQVGAVAQLGGNDFDGLRAIAATGDRAIVAGFFSGSIALGVRTLTAGGGDDAFVAELATNGVVGGAWQVGGEGREEVTALAAVPGGFAIAIAHSARASVDDAALPAPAPGHAGGAFAIRGVR